MSTRNLSPRASAALRALAVTVTPSLEGVAAPGPDDVVAFVDRYLPRLPRDLSRLLPLGLLCFDWLAILWCGRRFVNATAVQRAGYVRAWAQSRFRLFREMMKGLSALAMLAFYSDPGVGAHFGYRPDAWIAQVKARRLERYGEDIRVREARVHGG